MGVLCGPSGRRESREGAPSLSWSGGLGPVISRLLRELPEAVSVPDQLVERGRVLDNYYIPSRYPNGHPEGAPFEHFGPL